MSSALTYKISKLRSFKKVMKCTKITVVRITIQITQHFIYLSVIKSKFRVVSE